MSWQLVTMVTKVTWLSDNTHHITMLSHYSTVWNHKVPVDHKYSKSQSTFNNISSEFTAQIQQYLWKLYFYADQEKTEPRIRGLYILWAISSGQSYNRALWLRGIYLCYPLSQGIHYPTPKQTLDHPLYTGVSPSVLWYPTLGCYSTYSIYGRTIFHITCTLKCWTCSF